MRRIVDRRVGMKGFVLAVSVGWICAAGCAEEADPSEASVGLAGAEGPTSSSEVLPFHCVAPWGIDWNQVLGIDAEIVSPFCRHVHPGHRYTPEALWITNTENGVAGHPLVYPDGYVPTSKIPVNDFLLKLQRVRYVVQPGGKELTFPAWDIEKIVTVGDLLRGEGTFTPAEFVKPAVALLGELPPVVPGTYLAEIHFIMSDRHCDGQTTNPADSCVPAGDTLVLTRPFVVAP